MARAFGQRSRTTSGLNCEQNSDSEHRVKDESPFENATTTVRSTFRTTADSARHSSTPQPHHRKMFSSLANLQPRQLAAQVLNFALVLSTAFMLWKGLSVATNSSSPIVVVLSGSMEPAFQRGDLLFLWNRGMETQVGEVVVYNVRGKDIPIVHRVIRRFGGG